MLRHRIWTYIWFFKGKRTKLDFIGESFISMAARFHGELNPVISYICMFDVLRQRNFSGKFLELGGGYSTIILPNILDVGQTSITSVDLNPDKYDWILNSKKSKSYFLSTIKNIQKPTVSLQEVFSGLEILRLKLADIRKERLVSVLSQYIRGDKNILDHVVNAIYSGNGKDLKMLVMNHHAYLEDLKFYKSYGNETGSGYCAEIAQGGYSADAIFFDCGEVSSVAEWVILSPTIEVGGYALFHDIYYPKSIKNFLVATYVELSDNWETLYRDEISPQGAMIAIRVK